MSTDAFDAASFDVDAYIAGLKPNEVTIPLYPRDAEFRARLAELEAQAKAAEETTAGNRGMDDASPEQVMLLIQELREERKASAVPIRLRELRDREVADIAKAAVQAGASAEDANLHVLSAHLVEPKFSPEQLKSLRDANREGESLVAAMMAAVIELRQGVDAPFSRAS